MAKAELTVHLADLPEVKRYVRQLEDAVVALWDWLPNEHAELLGESMPRLADFLAQLDRRVTQEVDAGKTDWQNVWAEEEVQQNERAIPRPADQPEPHQNAAPTKERS